MLDPKPPYILFEDNGDDTMRLTMDLSGMDDVVLPEGMSWPQTFLFPMGIGSLAENMIPPEIQAGLQEEVAEKMVHIPDGVD